MSSRLFFGGAAAAAAGYMIYEYQQQHERQRHTVLVPSGSVAGNKTTPPTATERELEQQKKDTAKWLSDKAEYGRAKANELTSDLQSKATDLQNKAAEQKDQVADEATTGWNRIKSGLSEDTRSVKEALLGNKSDYSQQQSQGQGSTPKDISRSIFNWGFKEAERAKAIAIGDYDRANKELSAAQENWNATKKGVFDSGDSVLKQKVDELKKTLEEKKNKLNEASDHYASFTKDNFNDISNKLDAQDERIRKEGGFFKWLTRSSPDQKKKDSNNKDKGRVSPEKADQVATSSLAGFGENAAFFSKEQIEDQLRNKEIGPSEAQRRLDELKKIKKEGWMNYAKDPQSEENIAKNAYKGLEGWGESAAEFAHEELEEARRRFQRKIESRDDAAKAMDDAAARVQAAKKQVDSTGSSWWQGGKEKTDELHERAKADFDKAVKEYDRAKEIYNNWKDKTTGKFWSSADGSVRAMRRKELSSEDSSLQEQLLEE